MNFWQMLQAMHESSIKLLRDVIDEFTDLIKEILKPRTFFAFMFYATLCYLVLRQLPIPDRLWAIVDFLLGFWFGSRTGDLNQTTKKGADQ